MGGPPGTLTFKLHADKQKLEQENAKLKSEMKKLEKKIEKLEKKIKDLEQNVKTQKSVSYKFLTHKLHLLNKLKNPNAKPKPKKAPHGLYKKGV